MNPNHKLRWVPLLLAGAGIQLVLGWASVPPWLLLAAMAAIGAFLVVNHTQPGFMLAAAGVVLNLAVMIPNGAMPVSASVVNTRGGAIATGDLRHSVADDGTVLAWLGDTIPVGRLVLSVGDVLLFAGMAWFAFVTVRRLIAASTQPAVPQRP